MASTQKQPLRTSRHTQQRGDSRRAQLLGAASELILRLPLRELTYVGICKRAGVPMGSAHHFYPDLDAIYVALLERHRAAKDAAMFKPIPARYRKSWQAVLGCVVDRAVRYHRANPVASKLAISGETPPNIKLCDRQADWARARLSIQVWDQLFVLPPMATADRERAAFVAIEIVDTVLMLSMIENGRLTPSYVRLAKAAAIGFLTMQFGPTLTIRGAPAEGSPE